VIGQYVVCAGHRVGCNGHTVVMTGHAVTDVGQTVLIWVPPVHSVALLGQLVGEVPAQLVVLAGHSVNGFAGQLVRLIGQVVDCVGQLVGLYWQVVGVPGVMVGSHDPETTGQVVWMIGQLV